MNEEIKNVKIDDTLKSFKKENTENSYLSESQDESKIKKKEKVNSHSNTLYKKLIRQRYIIQNFIKVFIIIYVSLSAHFLLKII